MRAPDPLAPLLRRRGVVLLDGGLATELEARGADLSGGLWSARLLLEAPERIAAVHTAYLRAGADCLIAATYQATIEGFERRGLSVTDAEGMLRRAVDLARCARDAFWRVPGHRVDRSKPLVAASIGPYGAFRADGSEYTGDYDLSPAGLEGFHRRRLSVLASAGADLLACETIPSAAEARILVALLAEFADASQPPRAWMSFTCKDETHLSDGARLADVAAEVSESDAIIAVGVNCVDPDLVPGLIQTLRGATSLPILVYPNSGERWEAVSQTWQGTAVPEAFAEACVSWVASGATIVGGCCRTGPEHIRRLRSILATGMFSSPGSGTGSGAEEPRR